MSRVRRPQAMMDDDYGYDDDFDRAAPRRRAAGYQADDDYDDRSDRGYDRRGRRDRDDDGYGDARGHGLRGVALGVVALALRHPVPVIGGATSLVLMTAIALNATTSQPGHHPAPLFETRPYADAATTATAAPQPRLKPNPADATGDVPAQTASFGAAQPRMKPIATTTEPSAVIKDLQALMTARGLYRGDVDGVAGPGTVDAIRSLERSLGLVQTGEASERLLAYARDRAAPGTIATAPMPAAPATGFTPAPAPAPGPAPGPAVATGIPVAQPAPGTMAVPVAAQPAFTPAPVARAIPVKAPAEKPAAPVAVAQPKAVPVTRPVGQRAVPVVPQPGSVATAPAPENRLGRVQRALAAAGFGPLRSDGVLDDPTVDAIRRYEVHRGWAPTGRLSDRLTLDLLMKSANR